MTTPLFLSSLPSDEGQGPLDCAFLMVIKLIKLIVANTGHQQFPWIPDVTLSGNKVVRKGHYPAVKTITATHPTYGLKNSKKTKQ